VCALLGVGLLVAGCASDVSAERPQTSPSALAEPTPVMVNLPSATSTPSTPTPTTTSVPTAPPKATAGPSPVMRVYGPGQVKIPILLYHHVVPDPKPTRYWTSNADFEAQMDDLQRLGYRTITIAQLTQAVDHGEALPEKPIVITFDDGDIDAYQNALPILSDHHMVAVMYVVANRVGAEGYLSADQIRDMVAAGWEIGSHSMTHPHLASVSWVQLRTELLKSRLDLEEVVGEAITTFAYPYGEVMPDFADKVHEYGYTSAVGLGLTVLQRPQDMYYLSRREVEGGVGLQDFEALLKSRS
jgi:peptidoglycan/xylan/chitin deacetylase (PgdA/CDA1 family)